MGAGVHRSTGNRGRRDAVNQWQALTAFGLMLLALSGLVSNTVGRIVVVVLAAVLFGAAGLVALGVIA
jgi:hypothetical protein